MYETQPSGVAPESASFLGNSIRIKERSYILRPETVESFFYLWRVTKDPVWRERGWAIFRAIEKNCWVPDWGYVPLKDVSIYHGQDVNGRMESFFLAETLKYLYLLFSNDSLLSIDE
jgi:hypothetical protein